MKHLITIISILTMFASCRSVTDVRGAKRDYSYIEKGSVYMVTDTATVKLKRTGKRTICHRMQNENDPWNIISYFDTVYTPVFRP